MAVLERSGAKSRRGTRGSTADAGGASGGSGRGARRSRRAAVPPTPVFVPSLPTVNLLPAQVRETLEAQRLRRLFVVLAGGLVGLVAAVWVLQAGWIQLAQNKVDDENATAAALAAKRAELAPVQTYLAQIETYRTTIQGIMAHEVLPSDVIAEVDGLVPPGVQVDTVGMTLSSGVVDPATGVDTVTTCPSPDPFATPVPSAGCVTIGGRATSRVPVGELIDRLEDNPLFTSVFISTAAAGGDGLVTFTGSVGLAADKAFSERYSDDAFLGGSATP